MSDRDDELQAAKQKYVNGMSEALMSVFRLGQQDILRRLREPSEAAVEVVGMAIFARPFADECTPMRKRILTAAADAIEKEISA